MNDLTAQVASIVAALQAPSVANGVSLMPCEVTVGIPVYQGFRVLGWTMHALEIGAQSVPLKVILAENGSTDGTQLVLRDLMHDSVTRREWMGRGWRDISVVEVPQNEEYPAGEGRILYHMRECHRAMLAKVDTPYYLSVDADVEAPRGAVRTMVELLNRDQNVGVVGIQYDPAADHVKCGMMMMRTTEAREWMARVEMKPERTGQYRCLCGHIDTIVHQDGRKTVHLSPLSARHAKLEV